MDTAQSEVAATLNTGKRKRSWRFWAIIAAVIVIAGVLALRFLGGGPAATTYLTDEVRQGDLVILVNTTGSLQPTDEVEVGAEVSGIIREVLVDFNDPVTEGQLLARLDTDELEASVVQAEASLASAEASLAEAQATAEEALSRLNRTRRLVQQNNASAATLETQQASYNRAVAGVARAEAGVMQADAALDSARSRMDDAQILSPIDGFVLNRLIEPGVTVASSLSAPHLFTIAHDLTQMELVVDVDEADIGSVEEGQNASFTVDAYPGRQFSGVITQVRNAPTETSGVVTYETILTVANPDRALRPGMTAAADIVVAREADTLLVPNAALRFTPPDQPSGGFMTDRAGATRQVWVVGANGDVAPHEVVTGRSDGSLTAVTSDTLAPGDRVAIGFASGDFAEQAEGRGGSSDTRRAARRMR